MKRRFRTVISSSGVPMPTKPEGLTASPWDIRDGLVSGNDRVFDHDDLVLGFPTGIARDLRAGFGPRRSDESAKRQSLKTAICASSISAGVWSQSENSKVVTLPALEARLR